MDNWVSFIRDLALARADGKVFIPYTFVFWQRNFGKCRTVGLNWHDDKDNLKRFYKRLNNRIQRGRHWYVFAQNRNDFNDADFEIFWEYKLKMNMHPETMLSLDLGIVQEDTFKQLLSKLPQRIQTLTLEVYLLPIFPKELCAIIGNYWGTRHPIYTTFPFRKWDIALKCEGHILEPWEEPQNKENEEKKEASPPTYLNCQHYREVLICLGMAILGYKQFQRK